MKLRTGFVSNSSSSSFVMVGVNVTKDELVNGLKIDAQIDFEDVILNRIEEEDLFLVDADDFDNGNGFYVGKAIVDVSSDDYIEPEQTSFDELERIKNNIQKKFGKKDVRLIVGTRAC